MNKNIWMPAALFLCILASAHPWSAAPAQASDLPSDISDRLWIDITGIEDLGALLTGDEGWIWLRHDAGELDGVDAVLLDTPALAWLVWWNSELVASSGTPPPLWGLSAPGPLLAELPVSARSGDVLLMKTYVRGGYTAVPAPPEFGTVRILERRRRLGFLLDALPSAAAVSIGLILVVLSLVTGRHRHFAAERKVLGLLGLFGLLRSFESAVLLIPVIGVPVPGWISAPVTAAVLPLLLLYWRKSVSVSGRPDPIWIAFPDWLVTVAAASLLALRSMGYPLVPPVIRMISADLATRIFIAYVIGTALLLWVARSIAGHTRRIVTALCFLVPILLAVLPWIRSLQIDVMIRSFVDWGLPAVMLISVVRLLTGDSGFTGIDRALKSSTETEDETAELEDLDEADELYPDEPDADSRSPEPPFDLPMPSADPARDDNRYDERRAMLMRSIRSSLYPDSLPWDPQWELASARQGSVHPATGFHDIYIGGNGRLTGFSFMDCGSDEFEAMLLTHLTRSTLSSLFRTVHPLPRIARRTHRSILAAAHASGRGLHGVIGRLDGERVTILPMATPSILIRRSETGRTGLLWPGSRTPPNPQLGSRGFGSEGLKILGLGMQHHDVLLAFTPAISAFTSPQGGNFGMKRLADVLSAAGNRKPDSLIAEIIDELKDFCETDVLPGPLQLLALRRV